MRFAYLVLVLVAACWPPEKGGCIAADATTCIEYDGDPHVVRRYENVCLDRGDTWADAGCSEDKQIGGCRSFDTAHNITVTTWYYGDKLLSAAALNTLCGAQLTIQE
jgi:hypothetical protein